MASSDNLLNACICCADGGLGFGALRRGPILGNETFEAGASTGTADGAGAIDAETEAEAEVLAAAVLSASGDLAARAGWISAPIAKTQNTAARILRP